MRHSPNAVVADDTNTLLVDLQQATKEKKESLKVRNHHVSSPPPSFQPPGLIAARSTLFLSAYLLDVDNLAGGLLHLLELGEEVPEAALGHGLVGSKDGHLVQRRHGLALRRELAANDLVLLKLR